MSNEQKMKNFINALLKEYYPDLSDIDGGAFQEIAEQHGILIAEVRHQPCGKFCHCNEVVYGEEWLDGVKCFRPANWLSAQQSMQTDICPECGVAQDIPNVNNIRGGLLCGTCGKCR